MRFVFSRGMRPGEHLKLRIDFVNDLQGDTPVLPGTAVTLVDQADPTVDLSGTLLANPAIEEVTKLAAEVLEAVVDGKTYIMTFTMASAAGEKFKHDILIPVRAAA